ncbi:hypothetical protein CMI37_26005 [Candidatus Pacearchaeota archaeon]|nr:hypothetical protein [Candidatus Pacearchaeota archaeon]
MVTPNAQGPYPDWFWPGVLEQYEPAQYYSSPAGLGFAQRSPRRRRFFEGSYQDVLKDFYQAEGTAARKGEEPATFLEFLETNPWTARYGRLPQAARGTTGMMSNPRTRFLFNY